MLKAYRDLRKQLRAPMVRRRRRQRLLDETYRQFTLAGVTQPKVTIAPSSEPLAPTDVIFEKTGNNRITALIDEHWRWPLLVETRNKFACYAYWLNQTPDSVRRITANASDGCFPTAADYKFATTSDRYTPLPDAYFFRDRGYSETDAFAKQNPVAWHDRSDDIVWRGVPSGMGIFDLDPHLADNPLVIQRLRMAMKCRDLDVDFRFVACPDKAYERLIEEAGLVGGYIPTNDWGQMKYAIDIDGFTNAWNNFMQRLKLGCCVLKVDSPMGYYQWYYHKLTPWEHYVPIRADLSDLAEQIDWVKTNPGKAREIAANGQSVARALTFESETQVAREAIEKREAAT
ncbi:MAG: glycosyl transferase family 90 [Pseudomonadota bacterium]